MAENSGKDVSAIDQALAASETMAEMAAVMYRKLLEEKMPDNLAGHIVVAAVTAWCSKSASKNV